MKVTIAYIEEPPFYWTAADHSATGSDIELAQVVLHKLGVTAIEYHPTTFEEFLPGVQAGRWDMNVPIFISAERSQQVAFSLPVWALADGFLLLSGNPKSLTDYESIAKHGEARLGAVAGTVQIGAAKSAGVSDSQIIVFKNQPEAVAALRAAEIDAYVGTAVGNRAVAKESGDLEAIAHRQNADGKVPVGGFSFSKENHRLLQAVNEQLRGYLGTADHRFRMAKYGLTGAEIDSVVIDKSA